MLGLAVTALLGGEGRECGRVQTGAAKVVTLVTMTTPPSANDND